MPGVESRGERPARSGAAARPSAREPLDTLANLITVARTLISMSFGIIALAERSMPWLIAAYAVYWIGDIADGIAARRMNQETVIGAVFDVICDRACTTIAAAAFVVIRPESAPAIAIFLIEFCVIDTMLTLAFLYFPGVISPNYFWKVDRPIYRWNWSPAAKAANTAVVVLLCLAGLPWLGAAWAFAITIMKLISMRRLRAILSGREAGAPKTEDAATSALFG